MYNFFNFTIFDNLFFIQFLIKFANFNTDFFFITYFFSLVCYAECRRFTWRRPTPLQQSRLDFFLISESTVPYVEQTDIQYGYRSDHSMIVLKFLFGKKEMKRKTFWKCNNSLLKDYAYVKERNEMKRIRRNVI